nr:STAS domain-containing protein [Micromonospora deserti]
MTRPQAHPEYTVPLIEIGITEELDLARVPEAGAVFDRILSLHPRHVVVDLSGCRHIDAAAIGLLLDVHRRLTRRRAVLSIRDPNPRIRRILQSAQLDQVLPVLTGPAQAPGGAQVDAADAPGGDASAGRNPPARPADAPVFHGRATVAAQS